MLDLKGKKAVSLLRVSTEKQTTKNDDIPDQRRLVNEFIEKEEMILIREFVEGGISGFKTKVADRDALTTIKRMADDREFDVLVVYKSDRIGRTTDESPMVIRYLNENNIRVFTTSGQELKTETLVDELITYLEFWRNKGESVKISERATDYKRIGVLNGKYVGGGKKMLPLGYHLVNNGSVNEKGRNILDFEIDPEDAELVKQIFKLSIENNMGARAISKWLNENGYANKSKNKTHWTYSSINYILNNIIYKGYFHMCSGALNEEVISPKQEHLVIISEEMFDKNQQVLKNRKNTRNKERKGMTSSRVLLSGLVYCGVCGNKMNLWANHKHYKTKDGTRKDYVKDTYKCYASFKYNNECDGQRTYSCKKIDAVVEKRTIQVIRELSEKKLSDNFKEELKQEINKLINEKKEKQKQLESKQNQVIILKKEIPLSMIGEGAFTTEELKESLSLIQSDVEELLNYMCSIDEKIYQKKITLDEYESLESGIDTWEKRYKAADIHGKKALINQVIDKVIVNKDEVAIDYKIIFETFKMNSENKGYDKNFGREEAQFGSVNCYKTLPKTIVLTFTRTAKIKVA